MEASVRTEKLARNSGAIGVPKGSSDSMLSSRYKANSRYVSIEAYPFALPCGERIEGEMIDACSRAASACWYSPNFRLEKIDFCLVSCTATGGPPQALVPVGALPDHGLGLLRFSLYQSIVTSLFDNWRWELRLDIAPERELRGGLELRSSIVRWRVWFLDEIPSVQYPGYCRKSRV